MSIFERNRFDVFEEDRIYRKALCVHLSPRGYPFCELRCAPIISNGANSASAAEGEGEEEGHGEIDMCALTYVRCETRCRHCDEMASNAPDASVGRLEL